MDNSTLDTKISEKEMLEFMKSTIVNAGQETLKYHGKAKTLYTKNHEADIVTQADLASNDILINSIKEKYPNHGIISEENKILDDKKEYVWIIDPLDGTMNFRQGMRDYSNIVALAKNNKVIAGAVYVPVTDELYHASKGNGAFKNGEQIFCSGKDSLMRSRGCGHIEQVKGYEGQIFNFNFSSVKEFHHWQLEFGSGGVDMMNVAEGHADWYFIAGHGGGVWDNAAPSIILKESGCKVVNFKGEDWKLSDNTQLMTGNPKIVDHILEVINRPIPEDVLKFLQSQYNG